jgi:peptidoglycan/LPS O-acetylase OafA/YrhL
MEPPLTPHSPSASTAHDLRRPESDNDAVSVATPGGDNCRKRLYIPSLDGVRAISFLLVFLSHAGLDSIVPGGFGVTVFFFLSGFLITSLLRDEYARTGGVDLRRFYYRRMLRIWPPMYLTIGIIFLLCKFHVFDLPTPQCEPLIYQALHLANYYDMFGHGTPMPGTGILWSLAVEEHFYLFWPAVFLYLHARYSRIRVSCMLAGTCAIVLIWRCSLVWVLQASEWRTYAATDTRIDSILFGCILALWRNPVLDGAWPVSRGKRLAMLIASATLLLSCFVIRNPAFRETLRYTLQGVALMPIFWLAVEDSRTPTFSWLNTPWIGFFGILTYSMYLSHFFLLEVIAISTPWHPLTVGVTAAVLTFLYAFAMHRCVERPLAVLRKQLHT